MVEVYIDSRGFEIKDLRFSIFLSEQQQLQYMNDESQGKYNKAA